MFNYIEKLGGDVTNRNNDTSGIIGTLKYYHVYLVEKIKCFNCIDVIALTTSITHCEKTKNIYLYFI